MHPSICIPRLSSCFCSICRLPLLHMLHDFTAVSLQTELLSHMNSTGCEIVWENYPDSYFECYWIATDLFFTFSFVSALLSDHSNRDCAVPGPVHVQRVWPNREDGCHGGLLLPQPSGAQDLPIPWYVTDLSCWRSLQASFLTRLIVENIRNLKCDGDSVIMLSLQAQHNVLQVREKT